MLKISVPKINIKQEKVLELAIALVLISLGVGARLLPHAPNFTPIAAIALFGGVYLSKRMAFILPLAAMVISDIFIGSYQTSLMIVVYGSFLLCVALGFLLKRNKKWYAILGSSFLASFIFFILTNFAVWAFTPWYGKTLSGILQCYVMALPFFKNSLMGDLFFTSVLFGSYETATLLIKKKVGLLKLRKNGCNN